MLSNLSMYPKVFLSSLVVVIYAVLSSLNDVLAVVLCGVLVFGMYSNRIFDKRSILSYVLFVSSFGLYLAFDESPTYFLIQFLLCLVLMVNVFLVSVIVWVNIGVKLWGMRKLLAGMANANIGSMLGDNETNKIEFEEVEMLAAFDEKQEEVTEDIKGKLLLNTTPRMLGYEKLTIELLDGDSKTFESDEVITLG